MKHIAGVDRQQSFLLPEHIEDYVGQEHPVRFIDAFVSSLDTRSLGFSHADIAATGRPPFHPADLLRLYLYGYLHRLRSSRQLERECYRNLELIWLMRKLAPDHKTIANFRKDHAKPLRAVYRQFIVLCRKLDLFGAELVAIDGSKFKAVNSRDHNYNESKLNELIAGADAALSQYLQQLDEADSAEPTEPKLSATELKARIAALQEKQDWHKELLEELRDGQESQVSTTDPDSRRMHTSQGNVVGYNVQSAVDAKHKLIVAADVTNEPVDYQQLSTVALEAKENLGVATLEVVADKGYYSNAEVDLCLQKQLTPFIARTDTSANSALGLYGKSRFQFDAAADVYRCPGHRELTYRFSTHEKGRELRYYRASDCKSCQLKKHCTRNKANRTITREATEHLMEQMAERVKHSPEKMKLRKALVEHPFGTIKRWFGYDYFLVKGLEKVRTEWNLITLAYNFKRLLNLVSMKTLMEAVS